MLDVFRVLVLACLLMMPVDGPVSDRFDPGPGFEGHWGVDLEVAPGTPVLAMAAGTVSFAGTVAGMATVTVDHGDGMKTSLSHLAEIAVVEGAFVERGDVVGLSGMAHGRPGVHVSVRLDGGYVDPEPLLSCLGGVIRLVPDR
ncbi:MAG: M23 family metallopeptidase [Halobacteriales archaeon]|nr:M23 family metallopeptidase [Halobacteriales archaeon]